MKVIRESCPSPLAENELVDDSGCPFQPIKTDSLVIPKPLEKKKSSRV